MNKNVRIKVILVEPVGGVNLGLIARLVENFEVHELRLVNPKLDHEQMEIAYKFSARAQRVLDNLNVFNKLSDAIKDLDLVFATSAVVSEQPLRKHLTPAEAVRLVSEGSYKAVGIVFGREASGLTNSEIALCDLLINIESSRRYRALNLANAVAIILYNFYIRERVFKRRSAPRILRIKTVEYFYNLSQVVTKDPLYSEKAAKAFSNIVNRGAPDSKEIRLVLGVLRRLNIYISRKVRK